MFCDMAEENRRTGKRITEGLFPSVSKKSQGAMSTVLIAQFLLGFDDITKRMSAPSFKSSHVRYDFV